MELETELCKLKHTEFYVIERIFCHAI